MAEKMFCFILLFFLLSPSLEAQNVPVLNGIKPTAKSCLSKTDVEEVKEKIAFENFPKLDVCNLQQPTHLLMRALIRVKNWSWNFESSQYFPKNYTTHKTPWELLIKNVRRVRYEGHLPICEDKMALVYRIDKGFQDTIVFCRIFTEDHLNILSLFHEAAHIAFKVGHVPCKMIEGSLCDNSNFPQSSFIFEVFLSLELLSHPLSMAEKMAIRTNLVQILPMIHPQPHLKTIDGGMFLTEDGKIYVLIPNIGIIGVTRSAFAQLYLNSPKDVHSYVLDWNLDNLSPIPDRSFLLISDKPTIVEWINKTSYTGLIVPTGQEHALYLDSGVLQFYNTKDGSIVWTSPPELGKVQRVLPLRWIVGVDKFLFSTPQPGT